MLSSNNDDYYNNYYLFYLFISLKGIVKIVTNLQ